MGFELRVRDSGQCSFPRWEAINTGLATANLPPNNRLEGVRHLRALSNFHMHLARMRMLVQ